MNTIKYIVSVVISVYCLQHAHAQTLNFNSLEHSKHVLNVGVGWDHGLSYSAGYTYRLNTKMPLFLTANFSIPPGEKLFDEFKTKLGGQMVFLNKKNLKGSVTLNGIFRRYENPLVRLVNFGIEMKGTFGYYKPKWFVSGEIGFDKAIVTHFRHLETFRETIYAEIEDGWYEPATGGNFFYGLQTGYSLKKFDITLNIGSVMTQDFKTTPLIPYYMMVGLNYRLP